MSVAQQFSVAPELWDELSVTERERLIAASRDQADMKYLATMSKEERDKLLMSIEWATVRPKETNDG